MKAHHRTPVATPLLVGFSFLFGGAGVGKTVLIIELINNVER